MYTYNLLVLILINPTAAAQDVSDFRQKAVTRFSIKTLPHYTDKALLSAIHSYLHITVKQILCFSHSTATMSCSNMNYYAKQTSGILCDPVVHS